MSLVAVRLHTGRTHQIRAHLSVAGHPLLGDATYGGTTPPWCPRIFLHARHLALDTGKEGEDIDVEVPLPADLRRALLGGARPAETRSRSALECWLAVGDRGSL